MIAEVQEIIQQPINSAFVVLNLILIESILSVDNATVLAVLVKDLKGEEKNKALKYGIWGAYFFRGLALLFAAKIMTIWWLKPLGGLYLVYITVSWWIDKKKNEEEIATYDKKSNPIFAFFKNSLGAFWSTVVLVELMDIAFSIDNVFAAVAFSDNIILVTIGVFIGILAMRFVAQYFVVLLEKYPFLEYSAFLVILILGLKLTLSVVTHFYPESSFSHILESENSEILLTAITMVVFVAPIITSKLFNFPEHN